MSKEPKLYFKTSKRMGEGATNIERALRTIFYKKGALYLSQIFPKISLTKYNEEWKLRIDNIDYGISICKVDGISLEINDGIMKFIEQDIVPEDELIDFIKRMFGEESRIEEFLDKQLGNANTMKRFMGFSDSALAFISDGGNVIIRRSASTLQVELSSDIES